MLNKWNRFRIDISSDDIVKRFKAKSMLIWVVVGMMAIIIILLMIGYQENSVDLEGEESKAGKVKKITRIDIGNASIDADRLWRNQLEESLESKEQKLLKNLETAQEEMKKLAGEQEVKHLSELEALKDQVRSLTEEVARNKERDDNDRNRDLSITGSSKENSMPRISKFVLNLNNPLNGDEYESLKTADNYIASGSFARGVLLSGVDASTSIRSSENPEPVVLRITDHGNLPRRFKSDLRDCHVIASVFGDLSSERVKVRLEKLSCAEVGTGEVIETEIAGFVTGEDGRQGIRGTVVSTDKKLLQNSLIGGVLGGLAKTTSDTSDYVNPFTIGMGRAAEPSTGKRIGSNLMSGAGSSLDRLSEYYIDRAEAIQPVIQVAAGRVVDLVFTGGVFFGTTEIKKEVAKKRDEKIKEKARSDQFIQQVN